MNKFHYDGLAAIIAAQAQVIAETVPAMIKHQHPDKLRRIALQTGIGIEAVIDASSECSEIAGELLKAGYEFMLIERNLIDKMLIEVKDAGPGLSGSIGVVGDALDEWLCRLKQQAESIGLVFGK